MCQLGRLFFILLFANASFGIARTFCKKGMNVSKMLKKKTIKMCLAQCLELKQETPSCSKEFEAWSRSYCEGPFKQNLTNGNEKKIIACNLDERVESFFNASPAINLKLCTHILVGPWFKYDTDFDEIEPITERINLDTQWKKLAQDKGVKVIMNFGSGSAPNGMDGPSMSRVANNPSLRAALLKKLLSLVDDHNFDGISFRWHYPACPGYDCSAGNKNDKANLVTIMKSFYEELDLKQKLVFLMVPHQEGLIKNGFDFKQLVNYVHYFYVGSFMFNGPWDPVLNFGTTKKAIAVLVNRLKSEFKGSFSEKLLMGHSGNIPIYFLANYTEKLIIGATKSIPLNHSYNNWATTCSKLRRGNYTFLDNKENQTIRQSGKEVVIFESFNSLKEKINLYKASGVGGMFFGFAHLDDADNKCGCGQMPLLRTMAELLNGAGCEIKKCP